VRYRGAWSYRHRYTIIPSLYSILSRNARITCTTTVIHTAKFNDRNIIFSSEIRQYKCVKWIQTVSVSWSRCQLAADTAALCRLRAVDTSDDHTDPPLSYHRPHSIQQTLHLSKQVKCRYMYITTSSSNLFVSLVF